MEIETKRMKVAFLVNINVGIYRVTSDVAKRFCPKCGNATLKKVSVTVNDDGSLQYYISNRKPINTRGMRVCITFLQSYFKIYIYCFY